MFVARLILAGVLAATTSVFAQPVLKPAKVTFRLVDATVAEVFADIERVARIGIQVDDPEIAEAISRKIKAVTFVNARLNDVMRFVSKEAGLTYEVIDAQTIRIRPKQ